MAKTPSKTRFDFGHHFGYPTSLKSHLKSGLKWAPFFDATKIPNSTNPVFRSLLDSGSLNTRLVQCVIVLWLSNVLCLSGQEMAPTGQRALINGFLAPEMKIVGGAAC